jgi:hypothetical protein
LPSEVEFKGFSLELFAPQETHTYIFYSFTDSENKVQRYAKWIFFVELDCPDEVWTPINGNTQLMGQDNILKVNFNEEYKWKIPTT